MKGCEGLHAVLSRVVLHCSVLWWSVTSVTATAGQTWFADMVWSCLIPCLQCLERHRPCSLQTSSIHQTQITWSNATLYLIGSLLVFLVVTLQRPGRLSPSRHWEHPQHPWFLDAEKQLVIAVILRKSCAMKGKIESDGRSLYVAVLDWCDFWTHLDVRNRCEWRQVKEAEAETKSPCLRSGLGWVGWLGWGKLLEQTSGAN